MILCAFWVFGGFLSHSSAAASAGIQLAWGPNPEPDIAGYQVRYGTSPGIYPNTVNAGMSTRVRISGLSPGITYHFVVVAYNRTGNLSPESARVSHQMAGQAGAPPVGTIKTPADDLTITTGGSVTFTGGGTDPNNNALAYRWNFGPQSGIASSPLQDPGSVQFNEPGVHTITFTVTNSRGQADPSPATRTITVKDPVVAYKAIPRSAWKLRYVNSQATGTHPANAAFDGKPGTFWQTRTTRGKSSRKTNEIQIDMGTQRQLSAFRYLPRQDGDSTGNIGKYRFYVSKDGVKWGKPVATGKFSGSNLLKQVRFKTKRGRYLRLVSLASVNGDASCNVAELQVLRRVVVKAKAAVKKSAASTNANPILTAVGNRSISASSAPPTITTEVLDGKKYLALTHTRLPANMKPTVEVSSDLIHWFSGENHTTVLIDNQRTLKVRDNTPITPGRKRHIRLKPLSR